MNCVTFCIRSPVNTENCRGYKVHTRADRITVAFMATDTKGVSKEPFVPQSLDCVRPLVKRQPCRLVLAVSWNIVECHRIVVEADVAAFGCFRHNIHIVGVGISGGIGAESNVLQYI